MSSMQNNSKVVSTIGQRLIALNKFVKTKTPMSINGKPMKPADVTAIYQAALDTRTALIEHRATFDQALAARDDAEATRLATDQGLKAWVTAAFGATSQEALEFGFLPRKVGAKSAATVAKAVQQNLATREARGTRGKKQKKGIKGVISTPAEPAVPATPVTAAPPAAIAPATPNGSLNGAPSTSGVTGAAAGH